MPGSRAREQLLTAVPELRPFWFATDITIIPPPHDSLAAELEDALHGANSYGDPLAFDLLWFDSRGHFLARVEAHSWFIEPCRDAQWSGLIGFGSEQLVVLAAAPGPSERA